MYGGLQPHALKIIFYLGREEQHVLLNRENTYIPDNSPKTWGSGSYVRKEMVKVSKLYVVLVLHTF